jgi:hypothetical protein
VGLEAWRGWLSVASLTEGCFRLWARKSASRRHRVVLNPLFLPLLLFAVCVCVCVWCLSRVSEKKQAALDNFDQFL